MRRPPPDLFKRNIRASWIMLETESLQGGSQSKNLEQWQPSRTKEDLAGGPGEQGCGEVLAGSPPRLSILYISNKLGGTKSWVSSSKQCQDPAQPPGSSRSTQSQPSAQSQEPEAQVSFPSMSTTMDGGGNVKWEDDGSGLSSSSLMRSSLGFGTQVYILDLLHISYVT